MREAVSSGPLINDSVKLLGSPGLSTIVEDFKEGACHAGDLHTRYLDVITRRQVQDRVHSTCRKRKHTSVSSILAAALAL